MEATANDYDTLLSDGARWLESGQLDYAIGCFQQALYANPDDYQARSYLGLALFQADRLGESAEIYEKLVADFPQDAALRTSLGTVYMKDARPEQARAWFEAALSLDPEQAEARQYLDVLAAQAQDFPPAQGEPTASESAPPEDEGSYRGDFPTLVFGGRGARTATPAAAPQAAVPWGGREEPYYEARPSTASSTWHGPPVASPPAMPAAETPAPGEAPAERPGAFSLGEGGVSLNAQGAGLTLQMYGAMLLRQRPMAAAVGQLHLEDWSGWNEGVDAESPGACRFMHLSGEGWVRLLESPSTYKWAVDTGGVNAMGRRVVAVSGRLDCSATHAAGGVSWMELSGHGEVILEANEAHVVELEVEEGQVAWVNPELLLGWAGIGLHAKAEFRSMGAQSLMTIFGPARVLIEQQSGGVQPGPMD